MKKRKLLVASSDINVISPLKDNFDTEVLSSLPAIIKIISEDRSYSVIMDIDLCGSEAVAALKEIRWISADVPVILISSSATIFDAVQAARVGANDYLKKPFEPAKIIDSVKKHIHPISESPLIDLENAPLWMSGEGTRIKGFIKSLEAVIGHKKNALLTFEEGTDLSAVVGCIGGAIPAGRQGITRRRKLALVDVFRMADPGSESIFWTMLQTAMSESDIVLLDNIQIVEDEKKKSIVDYISTKNLIKPVQIIAAYKGRPDSAIFDSWEHVSIPSLKERKDDLVLLLESYLKFFCKKYGKSISSVSLEVLDLLAKYPWPGNYREFECVMEDAVIKCERDTLMIRDLPISSNMLCNMVMSNRTDDLKDFKLNLESSIIKLFEGKTASEDLAASLLDIPKKRIS